MNLRVTILKDKTRADGSHTIRIALSHNGATRYFVTRFSVPSEKNLRNGNVVNVSNATYINQQLRTFQNKIYSICDLVEDIDVYTCPQLMKIIKHKMSRATVRTIEEINEEYLKIKQHTWSEQTLRLHKDGLKRFIDYAGSNFILSMLDSAMVFGYKKYLKTQGLSDTTVNIRMGVLRRLSYFATTHGYASYDIPPFYDYKEPLILARDLAIPLAKLRELRDMEITHKWKECARDIFMLSFYLCGMNLGDILVQDFRKPTVCFIRLKTQSRRNPNDKTEFTIQPEARAIINKYITPNGHLQFFGRTTKKSIQHITDDYIRQFRADLGIDKLVFYSARKTFAQLSNELMIKDTIIEYCIGDAPSNPRRALNFYIRINKRMADKAIRRVFDAVASDEPIEKLISDAII